MNDSIQFETPENVQISYQPSGVGTRFVAWFVDNILMMLLGFVLFLVVAVVGVAAEGLFRELLEPLRDIAEDTADPSIQELQQIGMYFIGIWWLVWSLGSFFYYTFSELLMRGQTIGKRLSSVRVVKADGFSLDAASIFVRNIFRVVDQLPPLWIVPVISARSQRFGDMVAGTVVIDDEPEEMGTLREVLLRRSAAESNFRFDNTMLNRLRATDFDAVERILDRWNDLRIGQQSQLLEQLVVPLAKRLKIDPPDASDQLQFVEDLLTAEYRRQSRKLG
jgi:uncharacterized RDD family membrane protein YckC